MRCETEAEYYNRIREWHDHFCLVPREIDGQVVWLETVQRRLAWRREPSIYGPGESMWAYRLPRHDPHEPSQKQLREEVEARRRKSETDFVMGTIDAMVDADRLTYGKGRSE